MKKQINNFWLAAAAVALVCVTGCKDDDDFEYTFENCVETFCLTGSQIDGSTIRKTSIHPEDFIYIAKRYGIENINTGVITRIGTSKNDMKRIPEKSEFNLQPFSAYYIEYTAYVEHEGDTIYGEKKELMFYTELPGRVGLNLSTTDYGDGEFANKIEWSYYLKTDYNTQELSSDIFAGCTAIISIVPKIDTTYNKTPIEVPASDGFCYIKAGEDYPSFKLVYYKGTENVWHWDAVKYTFEVKLVKHLEDGTVMTIGDGKMTDIFMDKSQCVKDKNLNIYRYRKFGNQYWTIDDLSYIPIGDSFIKDIDTETLEKQGFRIAVDGDWTKLESYFGVEPKEVDNYYYLNSTLYLMQALEDENTDLSSEFSGAGSRICFDMMADKAFVNRDGHKVGGNGLFNSFPMGSDGELIGEAAVYYAGVSGNGGKIYRVLTGYYDGILRLRMSYSPGCIRLVKDIE